MDPSIWSRLPDDLLDRIIALLPLKTLLALRPTCKRFNSLLLTPSFLSLLSPSSSTSSSSSFLLLSHPQFSHRFLPLYDYAADHWRTIPTSSHLLSSSSGLLLFSIPPSSLMVLNLLTNCSTLVRFPTNPISSATLVSSPSSSPHGYSIFVPCSNSNWVFVYNSKNQSWSRFSGLQSVVGHSNSHQNGTLFRGSLLFTTPEPFSVVGFNPGTGDWDPRAGPDLPAELAFVRLVSGGGVGKEERLYLVGGVGRDGISRNLRVWELVSGRWEEVGRLPELMCRKFVSVCYHNYSHVYCLWHEGMVCVCCTTWPEVLFFKVGRGTWHWLSRCPLLQEKWSCGFRWFSFVPDLYALKKQGLGEVSCRLPMFHPKKYIPETARDKMTLEFLELRQCLMNVSQYDQKFTQLSRYADALVKSEAERTKRFVKGLRSEIRGRLIPLQLKNYLQVVKRALKVEMRYARGS